MKIQERNKYKYLVTNYRPKKFKINWDGIPVFMKKYEHQTSLYKHFFLSIFNHIIFFILLWVLFSSLKIGINNPMFKPTEKMKDIEFIIDGSANPTPRLSESKSILETESLTNISKDLNSKQDKKTDGANKTVNARSKSPDDFSIPIPTFKSLSSSFGKLGGKANKNPSNSSNDSDSIASGAEDGSVSGSGSAKGTGFDKNAARKVIAPYDISPYVNELKRNIRMNWKSAKNSEGKYVELFLRIAKDGRLIILNVKKTSESGEVDEAAINAVKKTLPLSPLPSKYGKSFLDLIFTFNSNSSSVGSRY